MIYWLGFTTLLIISFVSASVYKKRAAKKARLADIKSGWGKPKADDRNFKLIGIYNKASTDSAKVSDAINDDLDLDQVFCYIDRASSKPGQQYLYKMLLNPATEIEPLARLDKEVETINKNKDTREKIQLQLSTLNTANAYYLPELFLKEQVSLFSPLLTSFIQVSGIVTVTLIILFLFVHSQVYFLAILALAIGNMLVHYKSKSKIYQYTHSLPQLLVLNKVAKWLLKNVDDEQNAKIAGSLTGIAKLKRSLVFVNFDNSVANDPTDLTYALFELLKTFLLLEPLMFIHSLKHINKHRDDIEVIYKYVARKDVLIAIGSVRAGLPYFSKPDFAVSGMSVNVEALYHPLIENCIPNSIHTHAEKGVLITGSNMSGKTTFIRSLAINSLLAQTLNTCCAKAYHAPLLKIQTSIRVSDDVEEHKSYFQAEALSVLSIINQCESNKPLKTLVIIDEIFRGTNTIERVAAAKSVLAYLTANHNFVFVSTHDLELAELLGDDYAVYSFEEALADKRLVFDYKIKEGLLKNKNGIAILETLGYPETLVADAYAVSGLLRAKYLI